MAPIQFGVLMVQYQVMDAAGPLDILGSCSKSVTADLVAAGVPIAPEMVEKAVDIKVHHIAETMEPIALSSGFRVLPTTTCDDCPPLDFLIVGGPDPTNYELPERFGKFIRDHVEAGKGLFATCTGGLAISPSGVLDGKNATTNHVVLPLAKKKFPQVNWVEKQWVVDGNIWTAGGACAGMDMMAHWLIENYGMEVAQLSFYALDFEPRDIDGNRVLPQQHGVAKV